LNGVVAGWLPTVAQSWLLLSIAIAFEVCGTVCLRLSEGFTRPTPSLLIFVFYGFSFFVNSFVVRTLGLSIVYAVWSGVGTVAIAIIGFSWFKEPVTTLKLVSISLIVIGVIGLHTSSRAAA
jgi:small multidrug resistance pump